MRLMIFALGVLFLAGFASAIVSGNCDASMVAYWQMEGDSGDDVVDSFGSHNGIGFPSMIEGVVDNAANFDGIGNIEIADGDNALSLAGPGGGTGGFTIEFWFNKSNDLSNSFLLNKGNYQIKWINYIPEVGYINATVGTRYLNATVTSGLLDVEKGYHVVLTWWPAQQNLTLYVNNEVKDSATLANSGTSASSLKIGEDFVGWIDEVALYSRPFDADDVKFHYVTSGAGRDYCYLAGAGDVSSTRSDFTLAGCTLPSGSTLSAGSCSRNGMFYCGEVSLVLYETLYDGGGCSKEDSSFEPKAGMSQCCPSGNLCDIDPDDPAEGFVCIMRDVECSGLNDKDTCDKAGCFWIDDEIGCVDNPLDYSCSIYKSKVSCELDIWNVGSAGVGTERCGTYFVVDKQGYVIPQDSCKCDWVTDGTDEKCVFGYDVLPDIYGGVPNTFRCQKDFFTGDCIDGSQKVNWSAEGVDGTGEFNSTTTLPPPYNEAKFNAVLAAAGCVTDANGIVRDCGEPIIKLPGFSLFALISSLGIIGLVYFFRRE